MNVQQKSEHNDYGHFNGKVPMELRQKLLELATAAKDDFISNLPGWPESYGTKDIDAIYGYDPGGFIPFQLGGYRVSELYRSDIDSTYHISKAQTEAMQKAEKHMYASARHDFKKELEKYFGNDKVPDAETLSYSDFEAAGIENQFSDYENDWFEPALLRLSIWVDDPTREKAMGQSDKSPDGVYVELALNYLDQPYYRSQWDETLFTFNMTIGQTMRMTGENFVRLLQSKYEQEDF